MIFVKFAMPASRENIGDIHKMSKSVVFSVCSLYTSIMIVTIININEASNEKHMYLFAKSPT